MVCLACMDGKHFESKGVHFALPDPQGEWPLTKDHVDSPWPLRGPVREVLLQRLSTNVGSQASLMLQSWPGSCRGEARVA